MHISDLQRASVVDLPVLTRHAPVAEGMPASERVDVLDRTALNARLAHSYLVELMDRSSIA